MSAREYLICVIYEEVKNFYLKYRGKKCVIGYSFKGCAIFAMHVGSFTGRQFIAAYAFHGREWITARLALRHIRTGVARGRGGWIVPLVNPDGAVISQTVSPLWKANARGVDLNCNFDALWGTGRLNTRTRGAENCTATFPFPNPKARRLPIHVKGNGRTRRSPSTPRAKKFIGSSTARASLWVRAYLRALRGMPPKSYRALRADTRTGA